MYKFHFLLILAIIFTFVSCQKRQGEAKKEGISFFQGSWAEAQKEAKAQQKMLFVDAYTVWCGPCKAMEKQTFKDEMVAKYFNEHFINCRFDMEKEEGFEFAKEFPVQAYPTVFFIDSDGKKIQQMVGYQSSTSLLASAQKISK